MLYLTGTGLSYEDISVAGVNSCKAANYVYAEAYTSFMGDEKIRRISELIGKMPKLLERKELEEQAGRIVKEAKESNVSILTGGDPLIATTHKILFIEAKKYEVKVKVFHSSNILSAAIGRSGLDFYRFGPVCTVPRWSGKYNPVSFYETIEKNKSRNSHSLVLLDYGEKEAKSMPIKEAIETLERAEEHYRKGIISPKQTVFLLINLGLEGEKIEMTDFGKAKKRDQNGIACLIIPAAITDIEKETIDAMKGIIWH